MSAKEAWLLVDGTALFAALRNLHPGRQIDYVALEDKLLDYLGIEEFDKAVFITTHDPHNGSQQRFLSLMEEEDWDVRAYRIWEVATREDQKAVDIRFDPHLAFLLGRSIGIANKIALVSDSFMMHSLVLGLPRSTNVTVAFFAELLDARWFKAGAKVFDLSQCKDDLFLRNKKPEALLL
jgi:hypothetical protein